MSNTTVRQGPLIGVRVLEFSGLGPGPFAGMMLADMGADVVRIDRAASPALDARDITGRGKRSVVLDLKTGDGLESAKALAAHADILLEGFRPGVMERLGLGPEVLQARNPRLIYGRITGWGQTGPLAHAAGHDLTYIAITGALAAIGPRDGKPVPPLNLVGDFGGGSMFLLFGLLCALHERHRSGRGQVIDAAMIDGVTALLSPLHGLREQGMWSGRRGENLLDGGAHFYTTYRTSDDAYIAVGPIEPQFYKLLLDRLGLANDAALTQQMQSDQWPDLTRKLESVFATRTRAEWVSLLEGTDACVAPVLDFDEAPDHPHNTARQAYVTIDGIRQAAPAPRFSRTPPKQPEPPGASGSELTALLQEWGLRLGHDAL